MDLKTTQNKVVSSYGDLTGISAKFVMGSERSIKFRLTEFDGSNEEAVNKIAIMIQIARGRDKVSLL